MNLTGVTVPIELVIPVVLGLVAAIKWFAKRYDGAIAQLTGLKGRNREAAVVLRESLRDRDPDLEPLSFDDASAVIEVEHNKDIERVKRKSLRPPSELSPEQEKRIKRYVQTGDPSTPPDSIPPLPKKKWWNE